MALLVHVLLLFVSPFAAVHEPSSCLLYQLTQAVTFHSSPVQFWPSSLPVTNVLKRMRRDSTSTSFLLTSPSSVSSSSVPASGKLTVNQSIDEPQPDQVYIDFLQNTRFWVQRVLSPVVIAIGVIGNGLTIVVMTRKRMRSSTNCYLAALASVDMAYLLCTFALSLKHYPGWRNVQFAPYWRSLPVLMMLADACSNISVWLTATFTLERFVVVSHPIKGKLWCTESRARKICACIFTFCLFFVLPTPFEWTVVEERLSASKRVQLTMYPSEFGQNQTYKSVYYWLTAVLFIFIPLFTLIVFNTFLIRSVRNSTRTRAAMTQSKYATTKRNTPSTLITPTIQTAGTSPSRTGPSSRNSSPEERRPGNCAMSRMEQQSAAQETKITIMLISVVFLFLICQLPVACSLIYTSIRELDPAQNEFYVITAINNIINLMVAVNAAGNFVLYCLLSQKYRRTLLTLICPCVKKRLSRIGAPCTTTTRTAGRTTNTLYSKNAGVFSQRFEESRPPLSHTSDHLCTSVT